MKRGGIKLVVVFGLVLTFFAAVLVLNSGGLTGWQTANVLSVAAGDSLQVDLSEFFFGDSPLTFSVDDVHASIDGSLLTFEAPADFAGEYTLNVLIDEGGVLRYKPLVIGVVGAGVVPVVARGDVAVAPVPSTQQSESASPSVSSPSGSRGVSFFAPANGDLNCSVVTGACFGGTTKILALSNETDAHAELPNGTDYGVNVCCKDNSGNNTISNESSGTIFLRLSNFTDAHVEQANESANSFPAYISASTRPVSCAINETGTGVCNTGETCLVTLSDTADAHAGNCTGGAYAKTVCCSINNLTTVYLKPYQGVAFDLIANGSLNGTLVNGSETSYETQTITYENASTTQRHLSFIGLFNASSVDSSSLTIALNASAIAINISGVTGKSANHSLFLNGSAVAHSKVRVCPSATIIAEVNSTCAGGLNFTGSYPQTLGGVTVGVDGGDYRIDNLTGSGAELFVSNVFPSIDLLVLNSSGGTNTTAENLTLYVINASDPDLDAVKNITSWYRNNVSFLSTYVSFDGGSNSTFAREYAEERNASIVGPTFLQSGGFDGFGAYNFTGNNSFINFSTVAYRTAPFTMAGWIRPNNATGAGTIIDTNGAFTVFRVYIDDTGNLQYDHFDNDDNLCTSIQSTTVLPTSSWTHFAVSLGADNNQRIFINGQIEATGSGLVSPSVSYNDGDLKLGISQTQQDCMATARPSLNASLDEFRIYRVPLSLTQINALYYNLTNVTVSNELTAGDVWRSEVVPNDGSGDGARVVSNNITILNVSCSSLVFSTNTTISSNQTCDNIIVNTGVILTINSTTAGNVSVGFFASNFTLHSGAVLNATVTGYGPGSGPGAGGNATTAGGAGHGGRGGRGSSVAGGNASGSGLEPVTLGSGGGNNGVLLGGRGGGAIAIVGTNVVLNGSIVADGGVAVSTGGGGGSGGSINIRADNLSGTGIIRAAGSAGLSGAGGGSGGRIFVRFNTSSFDISRASVVNGSSSSGGSTPGETGTLGFLDVNDDLLTIRQGWRWQASDLAVWNFTSMSIVNASTRSNDTILNFSLPSLSLSNSSISAETVVYDLSLNVTDFEVNVSNLSNMSFVSINASSMAVSVGSLLNATGGGFASGFGPGAGGNATTSGGGGHGGRGGRGTSGAGGNASGGGLEPVTLGSGGGNNGVLLGGRGGGAFVIIADTLDVNGSVVADGGVAVSTGGGGGSGGSINIRANNLSGTGIIRAAGSAGLSGAGGGSGGRIFVRFNTSTFDITQASVINGSSSSGGSTPGETGTLGFLDVNDDLLTIRQGWRWQASDLAVWNFTSMSIVNASTRSNDTILNFSLPVLLFSNSSIIGETGVYNLSINVTRVDFNRTNLSNLSLASINGSSILLDGNTSFNATAGGFTAHSGPGAGGNSTSAGGAGHGGRGGRGTTGVAGVPYGSSVDPMTFGSGGGSNGASLGGRGGGAVVIVGSTVILDGNISSNGGPAVSSTGGGAGGSINIRADNLSGSGSLYAIGSPGITAAGGGGSGRIFVRFNESTYDVARASVLNSSSSSGGSAPGERGTLGFLDVNDNVLTIKDGWRWQGDDGALSFVNVTVLTNTTVRGNSSTVTVSGTYFMNNSNFTVEDNVSVIRAGALVLENVVVNASAARARFALEFTGSFSDQNTTYLNGSRVSLANVSVSELNWSSFAVNASNLSAHVRLQNNLILVNSSAQSALNRSANITIHDLTVPDPFPTFDGEDDGTFELCPASRCTEISYNGSTFVFNVSAFTSFSSSGGVRLTKEDSPDPVSAGSTLSYTILINNTDGPVSNVTVTEIYPGDVTFNGSQPTPNVSNNTFIIGDMASNETFQINITVNVSSVIPNNTVINNTANLTFNNLSGSSFFVNVTEGTTVIVADNNHPIIAQVILNSSDGSGALANNASTSENLTVLVINATDADNDSIQNITDWRVNDTSIAVLNLPFETNTSLAVAVRDYSTFENNVTLGQGALGSVPLWNASGKAGSAFTFDGVNDYISTDLPSEFRSLQNFTISAWINANSTAVNQDVIGALPRGTNAVGLGFIFGISSTGRPAFSKGLGGSFSSVVATAPISTNAWHQVVGSNGPSGLRLYIDGVLDNSTGDSSAVVWTDSGAGNFPDPAQLIVGARRNNAADVNGTIANQFFFNGSIDEVLVFNRTFSAEQVARLYSDGLAGRHLMSLVEEETSLGDIWSVAVTPNDNQNASDGTTVLSNNVTILADPLFTGTPTLNGSQGGNTSPENLTANLTVISGVKTFTNWYLTDSSVTNKSLLLQNLPMDGGTLAGGRVRDYSVNSNDANVVSAVYSGAGGYDGKGAYTFDGSGDSLTFENNISFSQSDNWTITFWAQRSTDDVKGTIIGPQTRGTVTDVIWFLGDIIEFRNNTVGTDLTELQFFFDANTTLQHYAFVANGHRLELYVNGTFFQAIDAGTGFRFDGIGIWNSAAFDYAGMVDEFAVWNTSLTPSQIRALYLGNSTRFHSAMTRVGDTLLSQVTPNNNVIDDTTQFSSNLTIGNGDIFGRNQSYLNSSSETNTSVENLTINVTYVTNVSQVYSYYRNGSPILAAYYTFNTEEDVVRDYSGNDRNGSRRRLVVWQPTAGRDGKGLMNFAGSEDSLTIPTMTWNPRQPWSVSFWAQKDVDTAQGNVMGTRDDATDTIWLLSGVLEFRNSTDGLGGIQFGWDANTSRNFYTLVAPGSERLELYINGTFFDALDVGTGFTINDIGDSASSFSFDGTIDDVAIWNTTLTPSQIRALYNNRSDVLVNSMTGVSDTWQLRATPNDNFSDGNTTVLSMTVLDGDTFGFGGATLNALPNTDTASNLTANFSYTANVDRNVVWYLNGSSTQLINSPFDSEAFPARDYAANQSYARFGDAVWEPTAGIDGRGQLRFDGSNDYVSVPQFSLRGTQPWTLTVWAKKDIDNSNGGFVGTTNGVFDFISIRSTDVEFRNSTVGGGGPTFAFDANTSLHFYAFRAGGNGSLELFVNGTRIGAVTMGTNFTINNIGAAVTGTGEDFDGTLDEFALWNRSLSQEQIQALYLGNNTLLVSQETELGDSWQACAVPTDGIDDGQVRCTNAVTIADANNTHPVIAQVILNSTDGSGYLGNNASTNENLTVFIINATDADSDAIQNITDWRVNGTSIAVLNMPFETNVSSLTTGAVGDYSTIITNGTLGGGTSSRAPVWTAGGKVGGAYAFDGVDDYIAVSDFHLQYITVSAWVNTTRPDPAIFRADFAVNKDTLTAGNRGWGIYAQWNLGALTMSWDITRDGTNMDQITVPVGPSFLNAQHHVVGTYDGTTSRFYIDGELNGSLSVSGTLFDNTQPLEIGRRILAGNANWQGTIDNVLVLNRTLSAQQVYQLYLDGNGSRHMENLHFNETVRGDVWSVAVTPNDQQNASDGVTVISNNVTIVNEHPSIAQVILNSTDGSGFLGNNASTGEILTVFVINATDADNDSVQNITDWRVNGSSIAMLNMPFETNVSLGTSGAVRDYSVLGKNGTLGGGTASRVPVWTEQGRVGGAYVFDGVDDYINVTNPSAVGGVLSVSAWLRAASFTNGAGLGYGRSPDGGFATDFGWLVHPDAAGTIRFIVSNGSAIVQAASTSLVNNDQWQHVVATFDGSLVSIYVNGTLEASTPVSGDIFDGPGFEIDLGKDVRYEAGRFLAGRLDEVAVLNRSLSQSQIQQLYQDGLAGRHMTNLAHNETSVGDLWSVAATPNDQRNSSDGTTVLSNSVTILADDVNNTEAATVKIDSPDPLNLTSTTLLNYTITFNLTNGSASNVTFNETYPANVSFVNSTPSPTLGNFSWSAGNLTAPYIYNISILLNVSPYFANGTLLNNTVNVSYNNGTGSFVMANATAQTTIINEQVCPFSITSSTTLTQTVSCPAIAFNILADNVVFDCAGYVINYSSAVSGVGINVSGRTNVTVQNCNIGQTNQSITLSHGILLSGVSNSRVVNVSVHAGNSSDAIRVQSASQNNTVDNFSVSTFMVGVDSGGSGVHVLASSRTFIENGTSIAQGNPSVFLDGASDSVVQNVTTNSSNNHLYSPGGLNDTFRNNTAFGTGVGLVLGVSSLGENNIISTPVGVQMSGSDSILRNNRVVGTGTSLSVFSGDRLVIVNNSFFTTGTGVFFGGSNHGAFENNTIGSGLDGFNLNGHNNSLVNNTIVVSTLGGVPLQLVNAENNTFNLTTLDGNGTWLTSAAGGRNGSFTDTRFRNSSGSILVGNFTLPNGTDVTQAKLRINDNRTFVNSTNLSFLNTSAQITLNSLTFGDPRPAVDFNDDGSFTECDPPQCIEVSFAGGVYVFNVSGFTSYAASENLTLTINVSIDKFDTPDPVARGSQLSYQIQINSTGNATAQNVTVVETYPPNVTFVSSQPTPSVGNNTFSIGNLSNGSSFLVNITVNVSGFIPNGTVLNNSIQVIFTNSSGVNSTVNDSELTTVLGAPVLVSIKSDSPDPVIKGSVLNYTILINNTGDDTAFNVTLSEVYPAGVSFVSAQPIPTGNNTFVVGDLSPSSSFLINISVTVGSNVANGTVLNNSVNLSFQNATGGVAVASDSELTTVLGFPIVTVIKTDSPDPVANGSVLSYQITITNAGDEIAYNVTAVDGYPQNVSLTTTVPGPSAGNDTFSVGNLSPGQSTTINITVTVDSALLSGLLNNTVNVTFLNISGVSSNLSALAQTTVVTVSPAPAGGGGSGGGGGAAFTRNTPITRNDSVVTPRPVSFPFAQVPATNNELRTTNKEPQSTSNEQQTTDYELPSTNDELQTTNDERSTSVAGRAWSFVGASWSKLGLPKVSLPQFSLPAWSQTVIAGILGSFVFLLLVGVVSKSLADQAQRRAAWDTGFALKASSIIEQADRISDFKSLFGRKKALGASVKGVPHIDNINDELAALKRDLDRLKYRVHHKQRKGKNV